jgi:hypothetical protein
LRSVSLIRIAFWLALATKWLVITSLDRGVHVSDSIGSL